MRILLDLQACQASSMHRGIGRYSMALALAMARNSGGHELRIVLNEGYPDSVATIRKAFDGLLPQSHIMTFATPVPISEVDPRNAWRLHTAERIREHYLSSLRPDIVHLASLFEGLGDNSVTSVAHENGRFDNAVTLYDLIPLMHKQRYLRDPNMAAWYYRKLDALKRAKLLLAISDSARREAIDLLGLAPDQVVNISSAVDATFRPRVLSPEARAALLARHGLRREFIMYTGGIDYRKNIEGLIEAYARLPAPLRGQYQLAVVCSIRDPDRARLQRLAAKLGLPQDDLVLTGYVSDDDLVSLYNLAALFVFPSLHEGFGLPVLEAMACGAPVIGSNTSSIPEVIGRADAMFDPASVEDIATAMAQVLLDPARRQALREHGLLQAARFSWDASARRAIESFEDARRRTDTGMAKAPAAAPGRKPRLAYVSPLPPTRSGIAAYSAELLPELAQHYEIELVLDQEGVDDPALARFPRRSVTWFDTHAHEFDRIVYQFGNSAFHRHMFGLLERHPGVVALHEFFLSGAINDAEAGHGLPNHYCRSLYLAHGYGALVREQAEGRAASVTTYPGNKAVLDRAIGIIVHSADAVAQANRWYGPGYAEAWQLLPTVDAAHTPARVAALYREAIERFAQDSHLPAEQRLISGIATSAATVHASDLLQTAAAIAANRPRRGVRQLLVDVGAVAVTSAASGEHAWLAALLEQAPPGWRVEPVQHDGKHYRYARRFTLDLLGRGDLAMEDAVADAGPGDVLLTPGGDTVSACPPGWRARGVLAFDIATAINSGVWG